MAEKSAKSEEPSTMQKLLDARKVTAELETAIKETALAKANEALAELAAINLHYHLSEEAPKTNGTKRGFPSDAECPVCKFKTTPPHDRRAHKNHAGFFPDEELAKRGLVKV